MTKSRATAIGFGAVLLWALLALLTVGTVPIPPFQLAAMSFALGGMLGAIWIGSTEGFHVLKGIPIRVYMPRPPRRD